MILHRFDGTKKNRRPSQMINQTGHLVRVDWAKYIIYSNWDLMRCIWVANVYMSGWEMVMRGLRFSLDRCDRSWFKRWEVMPRCGRDGKLMEKEKCVVVWCETWVRKATISHLDRNLWYEPTGEKESEADKCTSIYCTANEGNANMVLSGKLVFRFVCK